MTAKVIVNPYSNRWIAKDRWKEAEAALKAAGVDFEVSFTERRNHATELAASAVAAGFSPIIAAGGDGTIGEVVNGLWQAGGDKLLGTLGVLPLGTANDLVHNTKLPVDIEGAVRVIAAGKTRPMDLIRVNDKVFDNNSALGFETYVTTIQMRIQNIKGQLRYLAAVLIGLKDYPKWNGRLEWDGGTYEGPISLITVGNGAVTGGLFYMAPHADPFDGKLTFVHGYRKSRLGMLNLIPKAMKPEGKFVNEPGVQEVHATWLKVHLDTPAPIHNDGEVWPEWVTDAEYEVLPGRVNLLVP